MNRGDRVAIRRKHTRTFVIKTVNLWFFCSAFTVLGSQVLCGQNNPVTDEYRAALFLFHPVKENVSGFGYLGYVNNPRGGYLQWHVGYPGFEYTWKPWLEIWGAVIGN